MGHTQKQKNKPQTQIYATEHHGDEMPNQPSTHPQQMDQNALDKINELTHSDRTNTDTTQRNKMNNTRKGRQYLSSTNP